eukprot:CAMPEP_0175926978 /NCGR_PEP_ID=MMETSP0108-20121206/16478_1 /TAXON_ID=195067 ORGANISM="Goniomonas pacifica, Strain CCMP1869" /NCGR_SAMPLE_ID=MMETSP0108 /ASSEMBLY_ACC=CAM_ASM_000204 /LENGTH=46 /DNA_ID= /DNA_START= /DNA_END= /DNA_ORIENTATION=
MTAPCIDVWGEEVDTVLLGQLPSTEGDEITRPHHAIRTRSVLRDTE